MGDVSALAASNAVHAACARLGPPNALAQPMTAAGWTTTGW